MDKQVDKKNEKQIKDIFLTITGRSMLPKQLQNDHNYTVKTEVHINNVSEKSLRDGSYNLIYTAEQDGIATIENEHGKQIMTKDKKKQSQKLRFQIESNNDTKMDDKDFYEMIMTKFRHYLPDILKSIEKWEDEK